MNVICRLIYFFLFVLVTGNVSLCAQDFFNFALGKPVNTSVNSENAKKITDGLTPNKQWRCSATGRTQWIEIDMTASFEVYAAHIYFDTSNIMPLLSWKLQYLRNGIWTDVPNAVVENNYNGMVEQKFTEPVETTKIRLITNNTEIFGVDEIQLWGKDIPKLPYGINLRKELPFVADRHWVCVNQIAYNIDAPKLFTVPTAKSDLRFYVIEKETGKECYSGRLRKRKGDFSEFRPKYDGKEYYIKVKDNNLGDGISFPFIIGHRAIQKMSYEPAVAFMNDARSIVGSHPSSYGGTPWRDGAYYTYEMPSMVLLYLSDKKYFDSIPVTLNWEKDSAKVLSPDFKKTKDPNDRDALTTAENYYTLLGKPNRMDVPDIIQNIRFTAGWYLLDPITHDPSGDPAGEKMHAQTVEQFAYMLFAYPYMKEYISYDFYKKILDAALRWWRRVGLFDVITTVGTGKGRECPGHSIMPNLMMYEVAKREKLDLAERFIDAAYNQTKWIMDNADWSIPKFTKGQRMSEHKLVTGLTYFFINYKEKTPEGLYDRLVELAENYITLSDNMWDFRRFDLTNNWTIPGFNECGNVAGFPACALSLAMCIEDGKLRNSLVKLAYSHFDNLYGRNPLNAHATNRPELGFVGVDKAFPYKYKDNLCARLEITRGSLSSLPGTEMYPFNPKGMNRHPEGWTAYNAAWNVSLAYLNWYESTLK